MQVKKENSYKAPMDDWRSRIQRWLLQLVW